MELTLLLLRATWIAATFPILIAFIPFSNLWPFQRLLLGISKRGKTKLSSSDKFSVPQKLFIHFYILGSVWTTFLLAVTWSYAYYTTTSHGSRVSLSVFLLLLMEAQVLRRLFESKYVFKYSPSARMHIVGYLTGLFYYIAAPLSLCCNHATEIYKFGLGLIQVKGNYSVLVTEVDWWRLFNPLMQPRWYAWIGAAIFFWGWIHQCRCHAILGSLRKKRGDGDEYVVPHGDWFEYVSSPHYLAEIVIYAGFVVATGCSDVTIWLLLGFVVANLVFAAVETHRWYLHKFDHYPKDRFAIFPFVY